ncbi:bifunctional diguanylate cyclase/phosphodiesterase [Pseudomonas sp. sp1636]|uniref:bifunctional diguanylate cyclase/phosphodiesterase n=1 Tax=Pseudomonas sp. sp1636 TaxID=3036707 RepID=UPI0025A570B4|nr:bifunctional diguanylate cyclase/phosphodiesterase [Pseudomonas sp. sp1636]MDM8348138.1 bifunctional diguanylate cyclase/phosphodiesterase [Pseudomonas sp. sp1636]
MRSDLIAPLRLAGAYILFSSIWILSSDYLLMAMVNDSVLSNQLQTVKGMLFVLLSSLLIFSLSYRDRCAQGELLNALTRNTRLLQQSQRNAALGSWEHDGRFHWSPEALQLLGRDPGSEYSDAEQLLSWFYPAERSALQRALQALLEQHTPLAVSARLRQPQRQPVTWLMLRGEAEDSGQILGTVQDISHQKHDEIALRESEQRFRQLFEQIPHIAVQGYDRTRRVIYWNQASTQLYGYSLQEAMGQRLEELIIPPAARNQVISAINRWLLGGPSIPAAELQLQRKDGSKVWVYSSHSILRNSRDQLELYCIDIDLSEQKQINLELQTSEARYRELVEQLTDVIVLTDASGHLEFLNPAWEKLSGYACHECLGRPLAQFLDSADAARFDQQIAAIDSGQQTGLRGEFRLLSRQGQLRWIDIQLDRSPSAKLLNGSLHDIHERHQEQQLQHARNAVLDELLARRPLAHILDGICRRLQDLNPRMLVSIMLLDEQQRLHVAAAPSLPEPYRQVIDGRQAQLELGSCGHAACSGELVIAENLETHPYWPALRTPALAAGLQACWSLPFKDAAARVLGTFGIYYAQPQRPSKADITLVTEFARLAGLAVQQRQRQR